MYSLSKWSVNTFDAETAYQAPQFYRDLLGREGRAFLCAMKSQAPQLTLAKQLHFLNQFVSLPFDDVAAQIFGEIRADLTRKGTPIGPYDLQIAAIARANQVTLVTHNTSEFGRIATLRLEDWELG